MRKMARVCVYLDGESADALRGLAKSRGVSVSALVREVVEGRLADNADDQWERAINATFGIMPELPDGDTYERSMRAAWGERSRELWAERG